MTIRELLLFIALGTVIGILFVEGTNIEQLIKEAVWYYIGN